MQDLIMPYFIIAPDYGSCLGSFRTKDSSLSYSCDDDTIELEGYDDTPFVVPGIEEWCNQWEEENYKYIQNEFHNESQSLDPTWYGRGLILAQAFRQILPDEINLYYWNHILIEKINYFRINPDVLSVIGDTNICSETCDEDKLSIDYFPSIELPGVNKWLNDFERHVDFVNATADADFDWMTWIIQGLEMAKIIRNHLPQSVSVWFSTPFELRNIVPWLDVLINPNGSFKIEKFHT